MNDLLREALQCDLVEGSLRDAGWTPEYRANTDAWAADLAADGYDVHPMALEILAAIGGLMIVPRPLPHLGVGGGPLEMEPMLAAAGEYPRIALREERLGTTLCPIGEWDSECILLAARDGRIFAETTFAVWYVGDSISSALKWIIAAKGELKRLDI